MRDDYNPAAINWPAFAMFLCIKMVFRGTMSIALALDLDLSNATVSRARRGKVVSPETYFKLCDWMGEPYALFLIDPETGLCLALPEPGEVAA